jgi:DNA-binding transcriptional MerR regulator
MEYFNTQHVCVMFSISHQTVKNWSDDFAQFLSRTANPGGGRKRAFTLDDLRVFALVDQMHQTGGTKAEIRIALSQGQRADLPAAPDGSPIVPSTVLSSLKQEIMSRDLTIQRLQTERDEEHGQVRLLKEQLDAKEGQIKTLYIENAELRSELKQAREKK